MSNQPLQPLNRKPKTKFPESASALIQKQKQNSRSPLPRWYRSKNKIPGVCFRVDTEAGVPGIIILIFVFQENPKLPIRSVSREDADYVFFLSPFSPAALQTYGSREV